MTMKTGALTLRDSAALGRASALAAIAFATLALSAPTASTLSAQEAVLETIDPSQQQSEDFARAYAEWTSEARYGSPLVDHLPVEPGVPTTKDVLGYWIGQPKTLTYYEDILRYYRALDDASDRVTIEPIGTSDEGRELVVVWISSEENIAGLQANRDRLERIADPRGRSDAEIRDLIANAKPHYHLMGGLHSGETGPSEMLMELAYRLTVESSPLISQIRDNMYVSITPVADPDGRDRNVDWFYRGLHQEEARAAAAEEEGDDEDEAEDEAEEEEDDGPGPRGPQLPYWGKYIYHDNNRDINLSQVSMRAITDWYLTAHPPILHDLHESLPLLYTYSGGAPQNPNLDPLLFGELRFFSNWELSQMTKWGMPGVYTHAFMDGWSPGYLGSVSYNHNGIMRMYETQSGRDVDLDSLRAAMAEEDKDQEEENGARGGGGGNPFGGGGGIPTGRGGSQDREWYRGIAIPDDALSMWTRRNNTNYMQTAVLSALQLTSMFPNLVLENFWVKTRNSMMAGVAEPPHGYVIPVQRDMTRVATLVNVLRTQDIEVGTLTDEVEIGDATYPEGSYVVKLDQPYGRLAKNLLERQDYPDSRLRTYDDSGWTMGLAFDVEVVEIDDPEILEAETDAVDRAMVEGSVAGDGTAALAVAHLGSNSMVTMQYRLRDLDMHIVEQPFSAEGVDFPAGSFLVSGTPTELERAASEVRALGLTGAALESVPSVATHEGDAPRVAIYTEWSRTQELGWYRHAFDQFEIPFDLIYKERVAQGNLERDYDVIVMAAQPINRENVLAEPAEEPEPYGNDSRYRYLGTYGQTDDLTGGFGEAGVRAFEQFLEAGGTLITTLSAVQFPIEFGFARTIGLEAPADVNAQKPLIEARISRPDHPVFYGHPDSIFPIKYGQGSQVFQVGVADEANVLARYVGGEDAALSGLMVGGEGIADRAFAVDVPRAFNGQGRVIMFANNPVYRWQNHGEFNLIFNSIINWNDVPPRPPLKPVS